MAPVSLSGGRRRRPRWVPWGVAGLLLALAAALVVGLGSSGGAPSANLRAGPAATDSRAVRTPPLPSAGQRPLAPRHARPRLGGAAARAARLTDERVDRVLRYTRFVAAGRGRGRLVALTFDDGPSPYTGSIVRTLLRMRAPATFFVVGQQLRYFTPGLHDELAHGFVVGDHTVNHALLPRLPRSGQMSQIALDERLLRDAGGGPVRLFRPPYGAYDRTTLSVLRRLRLLMVMWSVDPGDWRRPGTAAIVTRVLRAVRPGAIVILHDGGGDRTQTIAALPAIIRGLRRRRLRLVTVPTLLALDPPPRHQPLPHPSGA